MTHDLKSRRLVCAALNRLFWKCPMPKHLEDEGYTTDGWARYWLAELRDGLSKQNITGLYWDEKSCLFKPSRCKQP